MGEMLRPKRSQHGRLRLSSPSNGQAVPECRCPTCGHTFDCADSFSGPHRPRPGDISICISCRSLNVFAMDLTVRQPTNQELIAVAGDPKIRAMTNAIARAHEKWTTARGMVATAARASSGGANEHAIRIKGENYLEILL